MTNRIDELFARKKNKVLSVYFTAGFPALNDTVTIIQSLELAGCDMIEIGIPFSDPLADGPVIQHSSTIALQNGMNVKTLFSQLKNIRQSVHIPLILMGYMNPVLQYGFEKFCNEAHAIGIDGLIIPDLPPDVFEKQYRATFESKGLHNIMLITPRTEESRIRYMEQTGSGFIYAVASSSTTGSVVKDKAAQLDYFNRIQNLHLKLPVMAGFGISNREQFLSVCNYVQGGIIGTAFIKQLEQSSDLKAGIQSFIQSVLI
jgi:tryptophan synthase alpha chain